MARSGLTNIRKLIDSVNKQLPPEQDFINDLKKSIQIDDEKEGRKPSKFYKPSSMNCIRNMYYTRIGKKPTDQSSDYVLWGICNSGTDTHLRVQNAVAGMQANGMDCEWIDVSKFIKQRGLDYLKVVSNPNDMETKMRHKTLNLSFMCDGLIKYKNHYYILEIKTESANKWYSRQGVDPSHYMQATAYSVCLGLSEVLFVYINRDIFDFKPYLFNVTDDMKHQFVGLIDECEGYVQKLTVPARPEDVSKKACEYCSYKTQCRRDG